MIYTQFYGFKTVSRCGFSCGGLLEKPVCRLTKYNNSNRFLKPSNRIDLSELPHPLPPLHVERGKAKHVILTDFARLILTLNADRAFGLQSGLASRVLVTAPANYTRLYFTGKTDRLTAPCLQTKGRKNFYFGLTKRKTL